MIIVLVYFKDLVECRSMFGTNYISLREVTRLGLCNGQGKLFKENAVFKEINMLLQERSTFKDTV